VDPELQNAVIRVEKMMKDMVENDIEPDLHSFMVRPPGMSCRFLCLNHRPVSVYRFPRRALMLCRQLCMGIQSGARFPARSADAVPATLHGHFTQATYRNRPIACASHRTSGDLVPCDNKSVCLCTVCRVPYDYY
jgi:hypothetical protein